MLSIMKDRLDKAYCDKLTAILVDKKKKGIPHHITTDEEADVIDLYRRGIGAIMHFEDAAKAFIDLTVTVIKKIEV